MKVFNLYNDELEDSMKREGWNARAAKVGEHIGGELIGAGLYEAQPGNKIWPYHTHHANEEWLLVVRGQPTLRTPEGERLLDVGDVACFPRGKAGAHQVWNGSDSPIHVRPSGARARILGRRGVARSGLGTRHSDAPAFANVPRAAVLRANYY